MVWPFENRHADSDELRGKVFYTLPRQTRDNPYYLPIENKCTHKECKALEPELFRRQQVARRNKKIFILILALGATILIIGLAVAFHEPSRDLDPTFESYHGDTFGANYGRRAL